MRILLFIAAASVVLPLSATATTQVTCNGALLIQDLDSADVQCPDPFGADAVQAKASLASGQVGIFTNGGLALPQALVSDGFTLTGLSTGVATAITFDLLVEGSFSADFNGGIYAYVGAGDDLGVLTDQAVMLIEEPATGSDQPSFVPDGGLFFPESIGNFSVDTSATVDISDIVVSLSVTKDFTGDINGEATGYLEFAMQAISLAGIANFINTATLDVELPDGVGLEADSGLLSLTADVPLPASGWLLLGAVGAAVCARRRA